MDIQLTDKEIVEVDDMMYDHVRVHAVSNSYITFACNYHCRQEALKRAINTVLKEKKE